MLRVLLVRRQHITIKRTPARAADRTSTVSGDGPRRWMVRYGTGRFGGRAYWRTYAQAVTCARRVAAYYDYPADALPAGLRGRE